MNQLAWYLYRLKRIPLGEYPYRINYIRKKNTDKYFFKYRKKESPAPYDGSIIQLDISGMQEKFPTVNKDAVAFAEKTISHEFDFFGIKENFGDPTDWHLDPKTGKSWPLDFWGSIPYRDGKTIGGIKFAWEINRLHHLPRLAIAFRLTGNKRYRNEIFLQLTSWLQGNPYPRGINWIMGIELGIRIINLIYTLKLLGKSSLEENEARLVTEFVSLHTRHLYRFPSKYTSGGNHAIAEALGLFAAGVCFPNLDQSGAWKKYGKKVLDREVSHQINPDGSSFECSIPYLQFVVDHFLIYYLLCKEYQETYSESLESRLKASLTFIAQILDENGHYPQIGDDDDGFLLKLFFGSHNNFLSLLNTGSILFNNPRWIPEDGEFDQKTWCLLGRKGKTTWNDLKKRGKPPQAKSQYFKNAGLAVFRSTRGKKVLFVGNSGPLGLKPLAGHGHADALSFWLSIEGRPVFIDPGSYLYHSGGKWRHYFRSTAAHNTIRVDKLEQAKIVADFIFGSFYSIQKPQLSVTQDWIKWAAGHDGYAQLEDPVIHQRKVRYLQDNARLIIDDDLDCQGQHLIECFFHLHPDCTVVPEDNHFTIMCDQTKVRLSVAEDWEKKEVLQADENRLAGWYSSGFNRLEAAGTILLSTYIEGHRTFRSVIEFGSESEALLESNGKGMA